MAESNKGGLFAKRLQKQIVRAKAKVLQNLGKAEKTRDEDFDTHVNNFHKQQHDAHRLQKELKKYIECAKEMAHANKAFYDVLNEIYEAEWVDSSVVQECGKSLELLWMDYIQKLTDQVMNPLNNYMATFHETKTKISKRGRKLVDYDNSRHNLDELTNQKKKDESKIAKSQDDLETAKRIFDDLNDELHTELPNLYDRRIQVYAENFTNLYGSEATFHMESGRIKNQLQDVMEKLNKEFDKGTYGVKRSPSHVSTLSNRSSAKSNENSPSLTKFYNVNIPDDEHAGDSDSNAASNTSSERDPSEKTPAVTVNDKGRDTLTDELRYEPVEVRQDENDETPSKVTQENKRKSDESDGPTETQHEDTAPVISVYDVEKESSSDDDDVYQVPGSNKAVELPEGVDYAVIVGHVYEAADEDELPLEPGEIIYVVPFDKPDEQDEGWLAGYKKGKTYADRGVFPENFTKRL